MRVIVTLIIIGDLMMDEGPLEEEDDITDRSRRPPDRGNDHERGYSRRGRPPDDRGPPGEMMEPPDDEGPPGNGREDDLEDKDHQAHQDLLDQYDLL